MTDARILYPQFRDEQSTSRYPFADSASLKTTDGAFNIGADTFIDAVFFPIGGARQLYIAAIVVSTQKITFIVGDNVNAALISGSYAPNSGLETPDNSRIEFFDDYGRPAGCLLSSQISLAKFSGLSPGTYTFAPAATEFVSTVVIPANEPGVRAITPSSGEFLTGDICLIGDHGVVLRKESGNVIRIDIVGVPLFKRALCELGGGGLLPANNYLKTINNCGPDEYGSFTFTATGHATPGGDTILRVYPDNNGVVFDAVGRGTK